MEYKCKLNDVDDIISSIFEKYIIDEREVEYDNDNRIVVYDYKVNIPGLGLYLKEGVMFTRYEDGEFYPDFSLTLVYDIDSDDYNYFEQDPILTTLHNYLHCTGQSNKNIGELDCTITFDQEPKLQ